MKQTKPIHSLHPFASRMLVREAHSVHEDGHCSLTSSFSGSFNSSTFQNKYRSAEIRVAARTKILANCGPYVIAQMSRHSRDVLYRIFIICHIPATVILALPLVCHPVLPLWTRKPLNLYLSTYNDPLVGGKSFPGGWFGGLSFCEVSLHLPYFLWTLTVPMGKATMDYV